MRPLRIGALFLAFATPALAQQPVPSGLMRPSLAPPQAMHSHPYLDRSEYLLKRTVAAGAIIGLLAGALQEHADPSDREDKMYSGGIVGAGLGILTGAAAAGVIRFVPPRPRANFEHIPVLYVRDMSRYLGFGAQVGAGLGVLFAMQEGAGKVDDLDTGLNQLGWILGGLAVGFVAGLVTFFIQH